VGGEKALDARCSSGTQKVHTLPDSTVGFQNMKRNKAWLHVAVFFALALLLVSCSDGDADRAAAGPAFVVKPLAASDRWTNTLSMVFAPLPGTRVLACVWETRVQDFAAFAEATGFEPDYELLTLRSDGWKHRAGFTWRTPNFPQQTNHPVVGMSWEDAHAFCDWLTEREQQLLAIGRKQWYRLPTEAEWLIAAGSKKYPWGDEWPPPKGAGNYAGDEVRDNDWPTDFENIVGYRDDFVRTAPVGSFATNALGLFDVGGNVWEWCDNQDASDKPRIMRGGSWYFGKQEYHLTSYYHTAPENFGSSCLGFRVVLDVGGTANP